MWSSVTNDHSVYFLKRGQVVIMLNDTQGCEVIVRVIKPGEPFGELCFCSKKDQQRDDCAQAVIDCEVLKIDYSDFLSYLRRKPQVLEAFTFTLCRRLADAERRIEVLSHRGAEARLGRLLLQLARSQGAETSERKDQVRLPVGHDKLARMAAMTRPHVSVIMGKLRARGLVQYDRGSQLTINVERIASYINQTSEPGINKRPG